MSVEGLDSDKIAEMALRLHHESGVEETVELVLQYALDAVGCDYAGAIFLHKGSTIETVAATDPLVEKLDKIQMALGQGPDFAALEDRLSIIVDDTEHDTRWPQWAETVARSGIRSVLNVRLYTTRETLGILNLYSTQANGFDIDDQAVAHVIARHAAIAIGTSQNEQHLWQAVDARKIIGQAQGILMERFDLDADQAFAVLIRYSQNTNTKLRDIAQQLITTRRLPDAV